MSSEEAAPGSGGGNTNDQDLYDEFGNYIGPDLDSSDDEDDDDDDSNRDAQEDDDDDDGGDDEGRYQPPAILTPDHSGGGGGGGSSSIGGISSHDGVIDDGSRSSGMIITTGGDGGAVGDDPTAAPMNAIVLHEDKEHYPSAEQVYGDGVRTAVLDEDAMDLDTPIVAPIVTKSNRATTSLLGLGTAGGGGSGSGSDGDVQWNYEEDYLASILMSTASSTSTSASRVRGVAVVGHLHHGKTTLIDTVIEPTIKRPASWGHRAALESSSYPRYTDILQSEQDREMSLVSTPLTALLTDTRGKSHAITFLDCPGHVQFHDESVAALRIADGAVLVVDAVEGAVMMHTDHVIKQAVAEGLPIVLVISKIDRLITELQLPPRDAYYKLLNVIEQVNQTVKQASGGRYPKLSPERGNVAFSSAVHGWAFTLSSFAELYLDHLQGMGNDDDDSDGDNVSHGDGSGGSDYLRQPNMPLTAQDLAVRLWGDAYYDPSTRKFHTSQHSCSTHGVERTFVTFVLEPLYKIYSACLAEKETVVNKMLRKLGVLLSKEQLRSSARPMLRAALSKLFSSASCGLVDMIAQNIPPPAAAARGKVARCYSGPLDSKRAQAMIKCDPKGPLMIHATKLYSSPDGQSFLTFGRVYSGTVRPGDRVRVLGEGYSPQIDDEDMAVATVETVSIPRGRSRTDVSAAGAGYWVLLQGVDATIAKTATIVGMEEDDDDELEENEAHIFKPLKFPHAGGESIMKLAIEPLNPAELPKMVEGLRRVSKAYPMVRTRVEESGEHVVFGTGELYMDCVMHDLRHVYSDVEVKVADPVVAFRETVAGTSSVKCFAETTNKRNRLSFIAEPLDEGMAERLEAGKVSLDWDKRKIGRFFQSQYGWDLLSSRSVWAFGDSPTQGTNLLMDDTLPSEVDKNLLNSCRSSIVQGFQWATREGPLCEEPVRGTKIKILDAVLADKPIHRGGGQIIPTARKTVHSSLLTATPRLMEPIYRLQIQCPGDIVDSIQTVMKRRRGHLVQDKPIPGTLLYSVKGFVPVLDSFGFETDLRTFTRGQAMVHAVFDHWSMVPGDPLDRSLMLHPLEPSPPHVLSRELLLKTRRRKGLSEDVSVQKFFDDAMKEQLTSLDMTTDGVGGGFLSTMVEGKQ